jgi:hypothetical protein
MPRAIIDPHLLQRRSARKPASRLMSVNMLRDFYRGFARMFADQDLAANKRETSESNGC